MRIYARFMNATLAAEFEKPNARIVYLMCVEPVNLPAEGYTSFDKNLSIGDIWDEDGLYIMVPALEYLTENTVLPTEIAQETGGSEETVDVVSGMDLIQRIKWENEVYRDAKVTLMACKWDAPELGAAIIFAGKMGAATIYDERSKVELRPWIYLLQKNLLRVYSPICDCPLFAQGRCAGNGEDPSAPQIVDRTATTTVTSVTGKSEFFVFSFGHAAGWANFGRIYFTTGPNAYARPRIVKNQDGEGKIVLHNEFPHLPQVGDTVKIEEGCDRLWETCKTEKDNGNNFQGFPFLPGQQGVAKRYNV